MTGETKPIEIYVIVPAAYILLALMLLGYL